MAQEYVKRSYAPMIEQCHCGSQRAESTACDMPEYQQRHIAGPHESRHRQSMLIGSPNEAPDEEHGKREYQGFGKQPREAEIFPPPTGDKLKAHQRADDTALDREATP